MSPNNNKSNSKAAAAKKSTSTKHKIVSLGPTPMKILNVAALQKVQFGKDLDKSQISVLTGIGGGSTIRKGLAALKKQEYIEVDGGNVIITDKGMDNADLSSIDLASLPKTNRDHHETIKTQRKLTAKEIAVFDTLADGRVYTKEKVRIATGSQKNSTWRKLLASLKNKNVLEYPDANSLQLTKEMFPFEPRPE